jgi:hypothetical protein
MLLNIKINTKVVGGWGFDVWKQMQLEPKWQQYNINIYCVCLSSYCLHLNPTHHPVNHPPKTVTATTMLLDTTVSLEGG